MHRLVSDEIPLTLTTRVTLNVSGKSREVVLGRALPEGFAPLSLTSGLPVRIEPDGKLRLQVRPGTWTIELAARSLGPVQQLARPAADGLWSDWPGLGVDARRSLRGRRWWKASARSSPEQTTLPEVWKRFPAYAMGERDVMRLTERRRGDADPAPDLLNLSRTLWLDFNGGGYTVSDRIGQLHRSWRSTSPASLRWGASGRRRRRPVHHPVGPQHAGQASSCGKAHSRSRPTRASQAPAASCPPFRGTPTSTRCTRPCGCPQAGACCTRPAPTACRARGVQRWSLLDIFLVLITALAVGRLFGWPWGGLALLTLVLSWQEGSEVPRYAWLAALAGEALVRVLPESVGAHHAQAVPGHRVGRAGHHHRRLHGRARAARPVPSAGAAATTRRRAELV